MKNTELHFVLIRAKFIVATIAMFVCANLISCGGGNEKENQDTASGKQLLLFEPFQKPSDLTKVSNAGGNLSSLPAAGDRLIVFYHDFDLTFDKIPMPKSGWIQFGASIAGNNPVVSVTLNGVQVWDCKPARSTDYPEDVRSQPVSLAAIGVKGQTFSVHLHVGGTMNDEGRTSLLVYGGISSFVVHEVPEPTVKKPTRSGNVEALIAVLGDKDKRHDAAVTLGKLGQKRLRPSGLFMNPFRRRTRR